jgi:hypothetical protein
MRLKTVGLVIGSVLLSASLAQAQTVQQQAFARWRAQDKCLLDAMKAFPNRDLDSQQKRDLFVDKCQSDHGLPPRAHVAPSEPAAAPAPESTTAH